MTKSSSSSPSSSSSSSSLLSPSTSIMNDSGGGSDHAMPVDNNQDKDDKDDKDGDNNKGDGDGDNNQQVDGHALLENESNNNYEDEYHILLFPDIILQNVFENFAHFFEGAPLSCCSVRLRKVYKQSPQFTKMEAAKGDFAFYHHDEMSRTDELSRFLLSSSPIALRSYLDFAILHELLTFHNRKNDLTSDNDFCLSRSKYNELDFSKTLLIRPGLVFVELAMEEAALFISSSDIITIWEEFASRMVANQPPEIIAQFISKNEKNPVFFDFLCILIGELQIALPNKEGGQASNLFRTYPAIDRFHNEHMANDGKLTLPLNLLDFEVGLCSPTITHNSAGQYRFEFQNRSRVMSKKQNGDDTGFERAVLNRHKLLPPIYTETIATQNEGLALYAVVRQFGSSRVDILRTNRDIHPYELYNVFLSRKEHCVMDPGFDDVKQWKKVMTAYPCFLSLHEFYGHLLLLEANGGTYANWCACRSRRNVWLCMAALCGAPNPTTTDDVLSRMKDCYLMFFKGANSSWECYWGWVGGAYAVLRPDRRTVAIIAASDYD
eukprot:TRINITY_DN5200_c0_g1_i2.p1 TRINITY_DN5200_c0_g1~~TRINITY_DN5200_c0_g1_i2.p1  ORF type:complete len:550 (+),score=60.98 TRINITY_DN5200_c0_g1_i2:242-1891(+)